MTVKTRAVAASDRADWDRLYTGYAAFYGVAQDDAMRDRVWGWLHDPDHEVSGFVAETATGDLIGLTHYRPFASPLRAITNCFLDDLFVDPAARGSGAAEALIRAVEAQARSKGWGVVRWITAEDNYRARGVYDRLATRTPWVTYDIKL
ncbi:GNAT family N-acetyltransferase [Sulfitobacter sp. HNIBRBA3233]|uniref:GNAT family N-acetyltransferase n=1 Tax=Sulfitobacter marinivivus TaxID=3158558 RepID=UPI0032DFAC62